MQLDAKHLIFGLAFLCGCSSGLEGFSDTFRADGTVENSEYLQTDASVGGDFFLTIISHGVSSGEVYLNEVDHAVESDFHNDSFERTSAVELQEENTIRVEVRGEPGDQLCVRVFEALPPEDVEEGDDDERTIYERCVDREAGPPNSVEITFEPDDTL